MNTVDTNLWFDQTTNRCNIMGTTIFEKCDADFMRKVLLERWTKRFARMRSKVVKRLDNYYFKEMTAEELRER